MTMVVPDGLLNSGTREEYPVQRKTKGSFVAYDLRDAEEGGLLAVRSHSDVHILVKEAAGEHDDARQNWRLLAERDVGSAVKLVLLEPNRFGSSFLTHGIVLKQGMELGVVKQDEEPRTMKSLGVIAGIAYATTKVEAEEPLSGIQPA
ncbi:MAG TPA: hypothetical protein VFH06_05240 [Candidatus Saccharimonadales bacterium]|nr:hypothetical protein [Candidatus Saccharimonadales bacterium]